jgi:hypothetical protein
MKLPNRQLAAASPQYARDRKYTNPSNRPIVLNATFISQLDSREVARNQRRYSLDNMGG